MTDNIYILLGTNLGDREHNLSTALTKIKNIENIELLSISSIYESKAVDMDDDSPYFLNQAAGVRYSGSPHQLLTELETVEKSMGRKNKGQKKPRIIDLDILLFGSHTVNSKGLIIPHRELLNRPFAIIPLLEISKTIKHPVTGQNLASYITDKDEASLSLYKRNVTGKV